MLLSSGNTVSLIHFFPLAFSIDLFLSPCGITPRIIFYFLMYIILFTFLFNFQGFYALSFNPSIENFTYLILKIPQSLPVFWIFFFHCSWVLYYRCNLSHVLEEIKYTCFRNLVLLPALCLLIIGFKNSVCFFSPWYCFSS